MEDKTKLLNKVILISIIIFISIAAILTYFGLKAAEQYEDEEEAAFIVFTHELTVV